MFSRLAHVAVAHLDFGSYALDFDLDRYRSGDHAHHICAPIELRAFVGVIAPRRPHPPFRRRAFRRAMPRQLKPRRSRPGSLALR